MRARGREGESAVVAGAEAPKQRARERRAQEAAPSSSEATAANVDRRGKGRMGKVNHGWLGEQWESEFEWSERRLTSKINIWKSSSPFGKL